MKQNQGEIQPLHSNARTKDFGDDPLPLSIFYLLKYSAYLKSIQEKAIIFWVYWF